MASASVRKRDWSVRVIDGRWVLAAVVFGLVGCPVAPGIPGNNNHQVSVCGNGVVEPSEECDGADLGSMSCADFGFSGGSLSCSACHVDIGDCTGCGDGTCATDETRQSCPTDCGVRVVSAGTYHVCAALGDGTAWCWGANGDGELGVGTEVTKSGVPVQVASLAGVVSVSAGMSHSCALLADGSAWCWGSNLSGELGNGTDVESSAPVQVQGVTDGRTIACGAGRSCVLLASGQVWCWGENTLGGLGSDVGPRSFVPVEVAIPADASTLLNGENFGCAGRQNGEVWCWGLNTEGQLGNGSSSEYSTTPVKVAGLQGIVGIGSQGFSDAACALDSEGAAWCWGVNYCGATGDGTWGDGNIHRTPVRVADLEQVVNISNSGGHGCAVLDGGAVRCWGLMGCSAGECQEGQLGTGEYVESLTPVPVLGFETSGALMVSAGWTTCAVKDDGTAWCWGYNGTGALGAGSDFVKSAVPLQVAFPD